MSEFNENVVSIKAMFDNPESFGVFSKEELLEFEQEKKIINLKKETKLSRKVTHQKVYIAS